MVFPPKTKMKPTSSTCILFGATMFLQIIICIPTDTITLARSIRDGESLVSAQGVFKLGFFNLSNNGRRYVGITYNNIPGQTVVWVANREKPLFDTSGVLRITNESVLVLVNGTGNVIWSTNSSVTVQNPVAQLYDSGNLVVRDENDGDQDSFLWQSFDYPGNTQLPGMKLGKDLVTGFEWSLTSWKSSVDPSPGSYIYRFDTRGYPQPVLLKDSVEVYREGPWNGVWFSENSLIESNASEKFQFVFNEKEVYYVYDEFNPSDVTNRVLYTSLTVTLQRANWDARKQIWDVMFVKPMDGCDVYEVCGAFGLCNLSNSVQCQCMEGFVPKNRQKWDNGVWSDGCVLAVPFNCSIDNGFVKHSDVKLPDTKYSWYDTTMTLDECEKKCLRNCSCLAYANLNVKNRTGCLLWFGTLVDVKVLSGTGQDLYVKMASSGSGSGDGKKHILIAVGCSLLALLLVMGAIMSFLWRQRKLRRKAKQGVSEKQYSTSNNDKKYPELPIFAFNVIEKATNFFSNANKLGEGGFGSVYKGILGDGQEIAVKRLSHDSRQGLEQFKNEAIFIAKLQHRNLVKLMGCCTEADEQILIYEYMPNKSLDHIIFDKSSTLLNWPKRLEIINGIARGLLYLHQDSRLRIVHRDLKASNILLDSDMNAKISDFGMARSFDGNQEQAKTKRVVGTYGYMPPEYTIDGLFSLKSDVFSFGVLLLEIVSGKGNRRFTHPDHHHNLLGHTWMLFREGAILDVVDPSIKESSIDTSQMQRTIHIGLLCVQQHPEDRPSMSLVTVMLSSNSELPDPKEPGFFVGRNMPQETGSTYSESISNDEMSITLLSAR